MSNLVEPGKNPKPGKLSAKQVVGDAAERWLARNRSLVLRQTPVWAQSLVVIFIAMGSIAVFGAIFFKIDEVITVSGQLEAINGTTDVKTPAGGKVAAVFFKDGELIRKGQRLVRFDTRQAADEKATLSSLILLEQKDLQNKKAILGERYSVLAQKVNTNEGIVRELKGLVDKGGFQRVQYLQQLDQLFELKSQLQSVKLEMSRIVLETDKSIGQMRNKLRSAELQLQYQNVMAPASGIVFDPKVRVDGVLQAGETILTIVPQQGLKAKVFVSNKDIGFVKTGLFAKVRVDAFPFTRYGELEGKVYQIGADALPPSEVANYYRFPVKLSLNRSFLKSQGVVIPLRSGMAITANLKLREKRVISLISDLLVDQTESVKGLRQQ